MEQYPVPSFFDFRTIIDWRPKNKQSVIKSELIPTSELVNIVIDNISCQGTSSATTCILDYGVNVISIATGSDFCAKLPQPKTGKTVLVINKSSIAINLYPSNVGGQINNLPINQEAVIPPDGKLYEFICIKNPLPGAWTWNNPATSQYDSGDILGDITLGSSAVLSASDTTRVIENGGFFGTTGWSYDGKNKPANIFGGTSPNAASAFKPLGIGWSAISKIKVYTNMSATNQAVTFGLSCGSGLSYYDPSNGNLVTNGPAYGGNYGNPSIPFNSGIYGYCNNAIAGASLPQYQLASNIGDPGTCYGELSLIGGGAGNPIDSRVGDFYLGQVTNPYLPQYPTIPTFDSWLSSYINFQIQPGVNVVGFKFRFFIEYF